LGSGQQVQVNATGQFMLKGGQIMVGNVAVTGNVQGRYAELADSAFAQFAQTYSWENDHVGLYRSGALVGRSDMQAGADCLQHDCVTSTLDAVSTASATVAAVCAFAAQPECAGPAGVVSAVSSGLGMGWTAYQATKGNATEADLAMSTATLTIGVARRANPYVAVGASVVQYGWDAFHPKVPYQ
jgi:hypothetical protein